MKDLTNLRKYALTATIPPLLGLFFGCAAPKSTYVPDERNLMPLESLRGVLPEKDYNDLCKMADQNVIPDSGAVKIRKK
jgi:hypothetical protein